jgi:hypothetical protein
MGFSYWRREVANLWVAMHNRIMLEKHLIQSKDLTGFRGVILGVLQQAHLGFEGARQADH